MGNLKKKIQQDVIEPYMKNVFSTVKARVTSFDSYRNRADIEYQNPKGLGLIEREKVPIQINMPGFHSSCLEEGEFVWINFENGNSLRPKIVGIVDERYEINRREKLKHILQGGLVTKKYENKQLKKKNRISSWISENSLGYAMQINYVLFDIEEKYLDIASKLGYYDDNDIGFTHSINGSTIKIDKNGDINIFTKYNQGIKISLSENKIYLKALNEILLNAPNLNIDTDNINVSSNSLKVNGVEISDGFFNK